jgi:hypothetical protein
MKIQADVPFYPQWLASNLPEGAKIGFDPSLQIKSM